MNGAPRTPAQGWVFKLIIINVVVFFVQMLTMSYQYAYSIDGAGGQTPVLSYYLGLIPALVIESGYIWQVFTYMFLHNPFGFAHIFFNMYALLIFGIPIEQAWGPRRFLLYYLFCGTGAGISIFVINLFTQGGAFAIPTIGASGAVFGVLLAFGVLYPDSEILIFFVLPVKAKYLVVMYGLLELYMELFGGESDISHIGHLGGLAFGLVYFYFFKKGTITFKSGMLKARIEKKTGEYANTLKSGRIFDDRDLVRRSAILARLHEGGIDALGDDDIQYVKYLMIMHGEREITCEEKYSPEGRGCKECADSDECFVHEVRRYVKN